jgi:hypothetical protein
MIVGKPDVLVDAIHDALTDVPTGKLLKRFFHKCLSGSSREISKRY